MIRTLQLWQLQTLCQLSKLQNLISRKILTVKILCHSFYSCKFCGCMREMLFTDKSEVLYLFKVFNSQGCEDYPWIYSTCSGNHILTVNFLVLILKRHRGAYDMSNLVSALYKRDWRTYFSEGTTWSLWVENVQKKKKKRWCNINKPKFKI